MDHMISIIVTFHNEEQSIISCLQSIVAQTAQQWECVIVDNGSTDGGAFQVKNYLIDRRMRFFSLPEERPLAEVRATALEKTTGEWVMFVDGADYLTNDAVQALYLTLKKYGTLCAAANYYEVHGEKKRPASYRREGLVKGRQVRRGELTVTTGNSIFARSVAYHPEEWPALDVAYSDHIILFSGGQGGQLIKADRVPFWKKLLKWRKN